MGSNDKLQQWTISTEGDLIKIEWGEFQGRKQYKEEIVEFGLAGRSHEEQLLLRVQSRVNRKLDIGYVFNMKEAQSKLKTNRLGLKMPMLAKIWSKVKEIDYENAVIQPKLDGHRCLIYFDGEDYIAYSRNGKQITSITNILADVSKCGMQPGTTLDGELYHHGTALQTIGSWVRREQPNTDKLCYTIYDMIPAIDSVVHDCDFKTRLEMLRSLRLNNNLGLLGCIENITENQIPEFLKSVRSMKYEGLIIRQAGFGYQDGKRNNALIKVKQFLDDEFEVIDIQASKDSFCILHCRTHNILSTIYETVTKVTAPGTFDEKDFVLANRKDYIGRYVTVEFADWTLEGKLFHPIAKCWREKNEE
jgi:ATP-dependent DNA ligase